MNEKNIILDIKSQTFILRFWIKCVLIDMAMYSFLLIFNFNFILKLFLLLFCSLMTALLQLGFVIENPYKIIGFGENINIQYMRFSKRKEIDINICRTSIEYKRLYILGFSIGQITFKEKNKLFYIFYDGASFFNAFRGIKMQEIYNRLIEYQNQIKSEIKPKME